LGKVEEREVDVGIVKNFERELINHNAEQPENPEENQSVLTVKCGF
tara:strand:+ start:802 stop:939 length:138 start_codon:yes stop_codon:yes gene_type:complete